MTLQTVLLSIQALLATPEPDDPQDAGKDHLFCKDLSHTLLLLL